MSELESRLAESEQAKNKLQCQVDHYKGVLDDTVSTSFWLYWFLFHEYHPCFHLADKPVPSHWLCSDPAHFSPLLWIVCDLIHHYCCFLRREHWRNLRAPLIVSRRNGRKEPEMLRRNCKRWNPLLQFWSACMKHLGSHVPMIRSAWIFNTEFGEFERFGAYSEYGLTLNICWPKLTIAMALSIGTSSGFSLWHQHFESLDYAVFHKYLEFSIWQILLFMHPYPWLTGWLYQL